MLPNIFRPSNGSDSSHTNHQTKFGSRTEQKKLGWPSSKKFEAHNKMSLNPRYIRNDKVVLWDFIVKVLHTYLVDLEKGSGYLLCDGRNNFFNWTKIYYCDNWLSLTLCILHVKLLQKQSNENQLLHFGLIEETMISLKIWRNHKIAQFFKNSLIKRTKVFIWNRYKHRKSNCASHVLKPSN